MVIILFLCAYMFAGGATVGFINEISPVKEKDYGVTFFFWPLFLGSYIGAIAASYLKVIEEEELDIEDTDAM